MPQLIYLPRHPTFMEQFLPNFNQAVQMMMLMRMKKDARVEGRKEKIEDRQWELEKDGWEKTDPTAPSEAEKANYLRQNAGTYQKPDITVGKQGYQKPETTFDIIEKKGQLFSVTKKGNQLIDFDYIAKKNHDPSLVRQYKFAQKQFVEGTGQNPGDFTTWSRGQKKSGATTISIGEKVRTQTAKQVAKMQTSIRGPKFRQDAMKAIQSMPDADLMTPQQVELKTREEMDRRIRSVYTDEDVQFDERDGVLGWWLGKHLIRRAE